MSRRQPHTKSTSERGYGTPHQRKRAELAKLVARGAVKCCRCGERITPGSKWHLDHLDDPAAHRLGLYRGASCAHCNLAARNQRIAALARQAQGLGPATPGKPPAATGEWVQANW